VDEKLGRSGELKTGGGRLESNDCDWEEDELHGGSKVCDSRCLSKKVKTYI
jgi:hypothetical protein